MSWIPITSFGQTCSPIAGYASRWVAEMDVPYKLYKGDCLEIMPTLEAGSVDAIITDLPYGTTDLKWDSIIPLAPMWEQVKRILKSNGVFVSTASQPFTSILGASNASWLSYEWIWRKNKVTGAFNAKFIPLKEHENILVFSPAPARSNQFSDFKFTYNPQGIKQDMSRQQGKRTVSAMNNLRGNVSKTYTKTHSSYPTSVLEFDKDEDYVHPTQKPVALYEYLINTYTNFGETVLDITMGSGTTIIAAIRTGRKSIGIERDPKYFSIAEKRIKQAAQQPALFHATQQSVQRTGGESGQQSLFSAGEVLPAKVTRQSTRR